MKQLFFAMYNPSFPHTVLEDGKVYLREPATSFMFPGLFAAMGFLVGTLMAYSAIQFALNEETGNNSIPLSVGAIAAFALVIGTGQAWQLLRLWRQRQRNWVTPLITLKDFQTKIDPLAPAEALVVYSEPGLVLRDCLISFKQGDRVACARLLSVPAKHALKVGEILPLENDLVDLGQQKSDFELLPKK